MEEYCNNWDLEAVVRFACRLSPTPAPDPFFSYPPPPPPQQPSAAAGGVKEEETDAAWCFPDLSGHDADDLYKAFFAAPAPPPPPLQPQPQPPVTPRDQAPHQPPPAPQQSPRAAQPSGRQVSGAGGVPRSKRRKSQQKKVVCHVPADGVSADIWAWRKYGQKPIKGSPYPRGYYRCSSSKGCTARKQVERSRNDPNTFVITYTGDHNHPAPTHRNSLAGSTRQKFPAAPPAPLPASVPAAEAQASPPSTSAGLSPTTPLHTPSMDGEDDEEEGEEEAGALLVEDMEMVGEDELLFLKPEPASDGGGEDGAASMASLFDTVGGPDEPFFGAPWAGPTGQAAAASSGAAS